MLARTAAGCPTSVPLGRRSAAGGGSPGSHRETGTDPRPEDAGADGSVTSSRHRGCAMESGMGQETRRSGGPAGPGR